jgi:hypothetical protein
MKKATILLERQFAASQHSEAVVFLFFATHVAI